MSLNDKVRPISPFTEPYLRAFPENSVLDVDLFDRLAETSTLYVILILPRSGSTWFCEMIGATGGLGLPQEWFNAGFVQRDKLHLGCKPPKVRGISDINRYVEEIVDEGDGVAGVQLSYWNALSLTELTDGRIPIGKIKWFYLRRRDVLAQAISLFKSVESGYWHSYQPQQDKLDAVQFDQDKCIKMLEQIIEDEIRLEKMMSGCGINPVRLFYEDIQAHPLQSLRMFAQLIGQRPPNSLPETELKKLRRSNADSWKVGLETSPRVKSLLDNRPHETPR